MCRFNAAPKIDYQCFLNIRFFFKQLRFKGNCRKVSSETTTKVKEEGNNDDTNEEQKENENEDTDTEDNDFVILDFVGKKGKDHDMQTFIYHKQYMICKKMSYMLTYFDNCRDNQENVRLCIWLRT